MSNDSSTSKKVNGFCGGIQALFQKAQEICNSYQVISSAEQLEKLEQKVCDLADHRDGHCVIALSLRRAVRQHVAICFT